jgi:hypothetical protein
MLKYARPFSSTAEMNATARQQSVLFSRCRQDCSLTKKVHGRSGGQFQVEQMSVHNDIGPFTLCFDDSFTELKDNPQTNKFYKLEIFNIRANTSVSTFMPHYSLKYLVEHSPYFVF